MSVLSGNMVTRLNILIVDDDAAILRALERIITQDCDADVVKAKSGADGLKALDAADHVSMVISDYSMPGGMSGHEFLVQVGKRYPELPRALVTATGQCDRPEPDGYVVCPKPFKQEDISSLVETYVKK